VTLRENTEWVETVEDGWNVLVGADYGKIVDAIVGFEGAGRQGDVFGRGDASERVCEVLRDERNNLCDRGWLHWVTNSQHVCNAWLQGDWLRGSGEKRG
jgi:UDP-N-acetylglucosamine 2-epimerase